MNLNTTPNACKFCTMNVCCTSTVCIFCTGRCSRRCRPPAKCSSPPRADRRARWLCDLAVPCLFPSCLHFSAGFAPTIQNLCAGQWFHPLPSLLFYAIMFGRCADAPIFVCLSFTRIWLFPLNPTHFGASRFGRENERNHDAYTENVHQYAALYFCDICEE